MFYVYVLYGSSLNQYYVGYTENVENRLAQHNSGRGNFTSKGIPWILVITVECANRSLAMQLERKIKKRGIRRYLQDNDLV